MQVLRSFVPTELPKSAQGWSRTIDARLFKAELYQLSYLGVESVRIRSSSHNFMRSAESQRESSNFPVTWAEMHVVNHCGKSTSGAMCRAFQRGATPSNVAAGNCMEIA